MLEAALRVIITGQWQTQKFVHNEREINSNHEIRKKVIIFADSIMSQKNQVQGHNHY